MPMAAAAAARAPALLFDLLTPEEAVAEAHSGALRFNIPFLTRRLLSATCWAQQEDTLQHMRIGYFGSSTGAAAALSAAAESAAIRAVVSRGGRTDLAAMRSSECKHRPC